MADVKISGLPASTVPLAGTEVLPIVQSSTTKKVSIANVTAGRAVSALSFAPTGSALPVNGLFLPATNAVGLSTDSEERLRVSATGGVSIGNTVDPGATNLSISGSVGIGFTGAPGQKLTVVGDISVKTGKRLYLWDTTNNYAPYIANSNLDNIAFYNSGAAELLRVFTSGGVSIGNTTDPGATNLSVTGTITQATTLGAYVWTNWNPSDVIGTSTVPSTGSAYDSTYVTSTFSAGTTTTTFNKAGKYLVSIMNGFTAGAAYTYSRRIMNLGGTATRYLNLNGPSVNGEATISSNYNVSTVFYVVATAGQTITIQPTLEITGASATTSYSGVASATFLYCGI